MLSTGRGEPTAGGRRGGRGFVEKDSRGSARTTGTRGATALALRFCVLGPLAVHSAEGGTEVEIAGALRRRLLIRLLLSANRPVAADQLLEDVWEADPPPSALSTLKSHVSLLRRVLGGERIAHHHGAYLLAVGEGELDATRFEQDAARGRGLLAGGDVAGAADAFDSALRLWRGPALAEVADTTWAGPEAVRLEEERAAATEAWLGARITLGEAAEVVPDAEAAVSDHPFSEGLWAHLITALYLAGRQADALHAYQRLRSRLGDELGITPSRELVALEGAILRQDLGEAKGATPRPTIATMIETPPSPGLPLELTSFVPRPTELAEASGLLATHRLVTLTGPGGTGKTRLALRLAAAAADRFDAVFLSELADVADPADVLRELAAATGSRQRGGLDLGAAVAARLASGRHLLVVDNCEHVLTSVAAAVEALLETAGSLQVLATSRSPLCVPGEAVYQVPALGLPDPSGRGGSLDEVQSVRLFVERGRSHRPGFELGEPNAATVASICVRLEGNPLALELAAARLRSMSLEDIESRLSDRFVLLRSGPSTAPARQRSLEGLIDWSYRLLDEGERTVLGRLGVFAGGFDLAAGEAVACCRAVPAAEVVEVLARLVDSSLLQVETAGVTARYRMLETVRDFVVGHLGEKEAEAARAAHAAHFLALVEEAAPHFSAAGEPAWRARLEEDDDNVRLAFATLIERSPDPSTPLRFGAAVSRFWSSRGYYGDEFEQLRACLEREDARAPTLERGAALTAAGYLMFRRGESAAAEQYLAEALAIGRAEGSTTLLADALRTAAWVADRRGDPAEASRRAGEAVAAAEASGEVHLVARAYDVRAAMTQHADPAAARRDYAEALSYCRASRDLLGQASALNNLAVVDLEDGSYTAALARFDEALTLATAARDAALLPFVSYGKGLTLLLQGDGAAAVVALRTALDDSVRTGQQSLAAYALLGLGVLEDRAGRAAEAAGLLGASSALLERLGEHLEPIEAGLRDRLSAGLALRLGAELGGAVAEGRRRPLEDVIRDALAEAPLVSGPAR